MLKSFFSLKCKMQLWIVLMVVLLVGLVSYQIIYRREIEGFTASIRHKMRPLLRNMRLKREAMTENITRNWNRLVR